MGNNMSRELLFKGRRTDNRELVEGYYFEFEDKSYITCLGETMIHVTYTEEPSVIDFDMRAYEVDPKTVCYYSGWTEFEGTGVYSKETFLFQDISNEKPYHA